MFADSFCVLSMHCVGKGLGTSFLYKVQVPRNPSSRSVVPSDSAAFLFSRQQHTEMYDYEMAA